MCEKCFEYSEKADYVMENCNRLLAENIRLRKQLEQSNAELKRIISSLNLLKEGFSENCGETPVKNKR